MPEPLSDIYFSNSTDSGNTFSSALTVNELAHNMSNMPVPRVASDGTVYVSWLDYNCTSGGTGTIYLDKSTDAGATWGTDIAVCSYTVPGTGNSPAMYLNGGTDALAKGAPVLGISPTNPNELYITYAADPDGVGPNDEADIFFIKSTDGGNSWTPSLQVNDDSTQNDQILPWMDVKTDGTIDIAWYDRRNDASDLNWDVYIASSIDNGNSFSTNVQINDQNFTTPTNPSGRWMGEYLGLAVDTGYAYIVFTTNLSDANGDVYFDKIANSAIPEFSTLLIPFLATIFIATVVMRKKEIS